MCGLTQQQTLAEQLLSQNYNRRAAAAKIDQEHRNSRAEKRVMIERLCSYIQWTFAQRLGRQQIVFSGLEGNKCEKAIDTGEPLIIQTTFLF